ncbi:MULTISPECIES: TetR/AcrR family transcriptional regulator [unclassified Rhodococcus (in: high G+C Gram-positive bacteria)]|uniref:TetR/AcrR family transcriptional regulator n=1 Tax=unclassified Rhodococcus (in: high G+C Gram-positive bacteria) TaxID=192944 RepID=UPI00138EDDC4|nr:MULTISPECIES: TetR family transcriptional regulator [unclassified Rhodococcus (in: high G+C Gram-positive bacteria)]
MDPANKPSRRLLIAEAAVRVLAERGPRGFTHRAVDEATGLGAGAVNYHAPNRATLLALALDEVFRRDLEVAARHFALQSWEHEAVVGALVGFVREMCSDAHRGRVMARHHLLGEGLVRPELKAAFDSQLGAFVALVASKMAEAGYPATVASAELFAMSVDGLLSRQVVIGSEPLPDDEIPRIAEIIARRW